MHKLYTLGVLELVSPNGQTLRSVLAQRKRLALLVYLSVNQDLGFQRRDHLLALLWPELDEERARHALRQTLYYLRSQLGSDAIVSHGDADVGVGGLWCDVPALREAVADGRLAEAVALRRGTFLEGFHVDGISQDFEQWISEVRAEVSGLTAAAAWEMVEHCERAGNHAEAAEWARRAARVNPFEDSSVQRLMTVLDRQGDRAAAVVAYEDFAARLRTEYDLEPAPETRALLESLRGRAEPRPAENGSAEAPAAVAERLRVRKRRAAAPAPSIEAPTGALAPAPTQADEATSSRPAPASAKSWRRIRSPRARSFRWLLATATLLAVGAAAGPFLVRGVQSSAETEPGRRVLVLPFTVRGSPDQQFLSEGMVDLLSSGLDGAGDLVAVPAPAVLGYLSRSALGSTPSPQERASLARHFGADLIVMGDVVALSDSVRVTAWVYGRKDPGVPVMRASAEASPGDILGLADRLVMDLAAGPESAPAGRLARVASANTSSLDAMKAYLEGQQAFRRGEVKLAVDAYQRAVRADSDFALGYYSLSVAASAAFQASLADEAAAEAALHMSRLPDRERQLLLARIAYRAGDAATAERITRAILFRHPNDPAAWDLLGETLFHLNPLRGRPIEEATKALERVHELDPGATEATYHLAQLAAMRGAWDRAAALADEVLATNPAAHRAPQLRLIRRVARLAGRPDSAFVQSDLQGLDDLTIVSSAYTLAIFLHDPAGAEWALALLDGEADSPRIKAFEQILRAQLEVARGRWSAAEGLLDQAARLDPLRAEQYRALLATAPWLTPSRSTAELASIQDRLVAAGRLAPQAPPAGPRSWDDVDDLVAPVTQPFLEGVLAARLGDGAGLSAALATIDARAPQPLLASLYARLGGIPEVAAALDTPGKSPRPLRLAEVYDRLAHGLAARNPAARDAEHLDPFSDGPPGVSPEEAVLSPFFSLPWARYAHAQALATEGDLAGASMWYASLGELSISDLVYRAPAHLRQAEISLERHDYAAAAGHYRAFIALWRDCDPDLRPVVDAVRQKLQTLEDR